MPVGTVSEPHVTTARPGSEFTRELGERFIRYARIDTQSDEKSTTSPSTEKQYDLLRLLVEELKSMGAQDVTLTRYGAALATIPATTNSDAPTVALLAHVDTAPQFSGTNVKPIVHRNYAGGEIVIPDNPAVVLSPAQSPYLAAKRGDDIITASGNTLLGADDNPVIRDRVIAPQRQRGGAGLQCVRENYFLESKRTSSRDSVMRTRFLQGSPARAVFACWGGHQRPNRSEGPCGKACRIEELRDHKVPPAYSHPKCATSARLGTPALAR